MVLWFRFERWGLERLVIRYQVNAHFRDIYFNQLAGPSSFVLLKHRSNIILFIFRNVNCNFFKNYGFLDISDVFPGMFCELFVDRFDIMPTNVWISKLGVPVVMDWTKNFDV